MKLKIDEQFKNLIRPLTNNERLQLEANILQDGCRDPLTIWNGIIVDGHNRYEICSKNDIPFTTVEKQFSCREEAISWICANQLGRRNLTQENRRYLIGMQYEAEKALVRNAKGNNQYQRIEPEEAPTHYKRNRTAEKLAAEHKLNCKTIQTYGQFSRAVNTIAKKEPTIASKLLSGDYRFTHGRVVELAQKSPSELRVINNQLEKKKTISLQKKTKPLLPEKKAPMPSVKDMPAYDPDAEITTLSLTIPSWRGSIQRCKDLTTFTKTTLKARERLFDVLMGLMDDVESLLDKLQEDT